MDWLWFIFAAPVAFVGGLMVALLTIVAAVGVVLFLASVVQGLVSGPSKPSGDRARLHPGD